MNFGFDDEQQAVKSAASDFLRANYDGKTVRRLAESGTYDDGLWHQVCELGWPGLVIDEKYGGHGLGLVELVILTEEMGYALAPSPFFSNVAAGLVLQAAGSDELKERFLPGIASGKARGTVGVVKGDSSLIPDLNGAEVVVLVNEGRFIVVPAAEITAEPVATMDLTRHFHKLIRGAGPSFEGDGRLAAGVDQATVALAGELVGVAQRAMEMAVEYAKVRQQFGRVIGAYQAVAHRCAQMLLDVESARSATYAAAWASDKAPDTLPLASSIAKASASDAGWRVTASALQVHGGIGFTWEHDMHLFLKRARVDGTLFGSATEHRERVAKYTL